MAERWLTDLADVVTDAERDGVPVFVGEYEVMEVLTGFHLHRGALASMQRPALPTVAAVVADARRVLVLEDIVDHTNVGAAFRSGAALGIDAILVTPRCADPFYRRAIRVSMGTVFQVPWTRVEPWPDGIAALRRAGFTVAALALADDAITLDELAAEPRSVWRWCSGPRATGWADGRSAAPTSRSGSRWPAASTRSTSRPPPPWPCGRCASDGDGLWGAESGWEHREHSPATSGRGDP